MKSVNASKQLEELPGLIRHRGINVGKGFNLLMRGETVGTTKSGEISDLLDISSGSLISVVGCGGKTSLIELLASENIEKKVLVSTTTKTFPMISDTVILCDTLKSSIKHEPQAGVQCLGQYNERNGKLEALPEHILVDMVPHYDIVLMEADGSRWLPCKGWRDNEPVIHYFSTHTVGVVTMGALGKAAAKDCVHHLPEFLSLTGLYEGDIITEQALEDMVCLPGGMFKNCVGQRYLLVNKVEDDTVAHTSESFLKTVKMKYPGCFRRLVYGSVHKNSWQEV